MINNKAEVMIVLSRGRQYDQILIKKAKTARQEDDITLIMQYEIFFTASHGMHGVVLSAGASLRKMMEEVAYVCKKKGWKRAKIMCYQPRRKRAEIIARELGLEVEEW